jgi:H-NS histone family
MQSDCQPFFRDGDVVTGEPGAYAVPRQKSTNSKSFYLAILSRGMGMGTGSLPAPYETPRRRYPVVLPKYRNPQTSETCSGRGKRPRWLIAALKSGRKIEEFRISESN